MNWELRHVAESNEILDDSGVYVIIHRIERTETHKEYSGTRVSVRADLMKSQDGSGPSGLDTFAGPIMSFQGTANAVRKSLIRFLVKHYAGYAGYAEEGISTEHASYIGYELLRAELTPGYVQD